MKLPKKVQHWIEKLVNTKGPTGSTNDEITCDVCNDDAYWKDFTPAERQFLCGPDGIDCPGFEGDDN